MSWRRTDKNLGGTRISGKVPKKATRSYETHPGNNVDLDKGIHPAPKPAVDKSQRSGTKKDMRMRV